MGKKSEERDTPSCTLDDLYRLQNIKRWQVVELDREQSVVEHSFNVAILYATLMGENSIPLDVLLHDAEELFTGDIPSPVKKSIVDSEGYGTLKARIMGKFGGTRKMTNLQIKVLEICDVAEAVKFLNKYGGGRKHAKMVAKRLRDVLYDKIAELSEMWYNPSIAIAVKKYIESSYGETYLDDYL